MSCLISRHFCVVSYCVGEIHLPAHPGAARVKEHLQHHPSAVGEARPSTAGQRRWRMGLAEGMLSRERDPSCSFLLGACSGCCSAFPWMNNPDYTESEDLCPSQKPTHFTPPPVSRLWTRLFQAGVVADINGLFLCILDNHRPSCWQASRYLRAGRPLLHGEHLSLSSRSVSCGELWPPAAVTPGNGKPVSCAAWAADTSRLLPLLLFFGYQPRVAYHWFWSLKPRCWFLSAASARLKSLSSLSESERWVCRDIIRLLNQWHSGY